MALRPPRMVNLDRDTTLCRRKEHRQKMGATLGLPHLVRRAVGIWEQNDYGTVWGEAGG
jgi:hypothetical protein